MSDLEWKCFIFLYQLQMQLLHTAQCLPVFIYPAPQQVGVECFAEGHLDGSH